MARRKRRRLLALEKLPRSRRVARRGIHCSNPARCSRAGRHSSSKVATAANGFPEREKIGLPPVSPAAICPPGFMITWSNSSGSAIWESNSGIRSVLPTAPPPMVTTASQLFRALPITCRSLAISSRHRWYSVTKFKQPSRAVSIGPLQSYTSFFPRGSPGCRNSSPMEITATRGLCRTIISAAPSAASRPICAGIMCSPAFSRQVPAAISPPHWHTFCPAFGAKRSCPLPAVTVTASCWIMQSAPSGISPPVVMGIACPGSRASVGDCSERVSSSVRSVLHRA